MDNNCTGIDLISQDGNTIKKPSFIVGQKNAFATAGYINSTNTSSGGYAGSDTAK